MSEPKEEYVFETVLVSAPEESELLTADEQRQALVDEITVLQGEASALCNQVERLNEISRRKEAEIAGLRTQVERLTKQLAGARTAWGEWQSRAESAERMIDAVLKCLRDSMILLPTNSWQLGYRSALIAVIEVLQPAEMRP